MLLISLVASAALAVASSIPLPSYPLAVKSPYLSTWLPYNQSLDVPNAVPEFWAGQALTWPVLARVDGKVFSLFACPGCGVTAAKQKSLEFTSTHTIIKMEAGGTEFTLDFFSPVSITDYVRESLPYSYLTVSAPQTHSAVEIFSAIDQSWTAQGNNVKGSFLNDNGVQIFILSGTASYDFSEVSDMATYGDTVFASYETNKNDQLTCASGAPKSLIKKFSNSGSLSHRSTSFTPGDWVACAHTQQAGHYNGHTSGNISTTFAVGLQRNDAILYYDGITNSTQTGYYRSKYRTVPAAVSHFFADLEDAVAESHDLDNTVVQIGDELSSNYTFCLEASVRQSFGGLEVTIPGDTFDTSQAMAFMKEISTDGNVNTVADLLPKAMPIFYVLAPEYIRLLTEPVLKYSYSWPLNHVVHDIGKHYPNATGETPCIEEFLPLDSDAVIFWMVYAYQKASGNTEWAKQYIPLLQKYTEYLVDYGLYPVLQRSAVDAIGAAPNQTALAMGAAISLKAFGALTGMSNYSSLGDQYAKTIYDVGTDTDKTHFLAHYSDPDSSWVMAYPLAIDKLLDLNTFSADVYEMESNWYIQQEQPYGIQFSSDVTYTLLELEFWVASTSSIKFQNFIADTVTKFLSNGLNDIPGPTQWNVIGANQGIWSKFSTSKSNIGSTFMIAAVNGQSASNYSTQSVTPRTTLAYNSRDQTTQNRLPTTQFSSEQDSNAVISVPGTTPGNACRPLAPGFVGLSIETSSFPAYAGSISDPNVLTRNLIDSLAGIAGNNITVRVGGASGDTAVYDAQQTQPIVDSSGQITLGPSFFESFGVLGNESNPGSVDWVWMAPLADYDIDNAVQQTIAMVDNAGVANVYAFEIGNEPDLYPNVYRDMSYTCVDYAAQWYIIAEYIAGNVSVPGGVPYLEALNLASGPILDGWTTEECFTAGIDAMPIVKTVSTYYYQIDDKNADAQLGTDLMNHTAIASKFDADTLPQVEYQVDTFGCIDYVLGEVGSSVVQNDAGLESTLGAALWAVDLMLYAISKNVSKAYMQQAVGYTGSAWEATHQKESKNEVLPSFYSLAYMSSFVGNATDLRVVPVLESETFTAYAGYENDAPTRIAIVDLQEWNATTKHPSTRPSQVLKFHVPTSVTNVIVQSLKGPGADSSNHITFAGTSWTAASQGLPVQVSKASTTVPVKNGRVNVKVEASEALLLTLQ